MLWVYVRSFVIARPTGEIVNDRPEYQNTEVANANIWFRDNQWVLTHHNNVILYNNNPIQGLTPPKKGWLYKDGTNNDITIHLVPIIPPPPLLSIQGDFLPGVAGLYTLSNTTHNGYPCYQNNHGSISVKYGYGYPHVNGHTWSWKGTKTGGTFRISDSVPPSYTPTGWNEWKVEANENKTIVSSNRLFCTTSNFTGYKLGLSCAKLRASFLFPGCYLILV